MNEIKKNFKFVEIQENRNILLKSCLLAGSIGPKGIPVSFVIISKMGCTFLWCKNILKNADNNPCKYETDGREYDFHRDSGNLFIFENRGELQNCVGFSYDEIEGVLIEFCEAMEILNSENT